MGKTALKNKIDNIMFRVHNMSSGFLFAFKLKEKKLLSENKKFFNKHENQRCFILGTGPSLRELEYDLIKDEIVFGVNFLVDGDIIGSVSPTYYGLFDPAFRCKDKLLMKNIIDRLPSTHFFLGASFKSAVKEFGLDEGKISYIYSNMYPVGKIKKIDITGNMRVTYNVIPSCIQIALYMGFKEIYLLGTDFNSFATDKVKHYYDLNSQGQSRNRSLGDELKEYSIVCDVHYGLNEYAKSVGVKIINLAPNSLLDAYERKSIMEILK